MLSADERIEQLEARLRTVTKERDALRAALRHEADCVEACKSEIEALRAKIEQMERQRPIGTTGGLPGTPGFTMACFHADKVPIGTKLYTLPGAQTQPAPSVPEPINPVSRVRDHIKHAPNYVMGWNDCRAAMLAATPERKEKTSDSRI